MRASRRRGAIPFADQADARVFVAAIISNVHRLSSLWELRVLERATQSSRILEARKVSGIRSVFVKHFADHGTPAV